MCRCNTYGERNIVSWRQILRGTVESRLDSGKCEKA